MSISGDKTFTGDIIFESNIHMNGGNVFVANTVNMSVSDPIIELGLNNIGTNDLGIIMTRPAANSNVALVYDESADILRMGYTLNGANDTVVDLDSNALAVSVQGALSAASVSGDGSGLTSLNASNITTGALSTTTVTIDDYLIHDGDTDTKVGFPLADTFAVNTAGSERLRVDSSGNVGIGTASPATPFNINKLTATVNPKAHTTTEFIRLRGDKVIGQTYAISGGIKLGGDTGGTATADGRIEFYANDGADPGNSYGDVPDNFIMCMRGDGNVGIGTVSPEDNVHIYSSETGGTQLKIENASTSGDTRAGLFLQTRSSNVFALQFTPSTEQIIFDNKGQGGYGFYQKNGGGTTNLSAVIDKDGNVGIGTANPNKGNLSVYGLGADPYFTGFNELNYADATDFTGLAHFHSSGSHGVIRISNSADKTGTTRIDFNTTLGAYWGVNSPQSSYFRGTAPTAGRIMVRGEIDNNYEDSFMTFHTCRDLRVDGVGGTGNLYERMRITSEGNVGIGLVDPKNKLDVRSDNYATFGKATYNAAGWSGIRLGTPYATNHDAYCSVIESYNNHVSNYNSDLRFKTSNGNNASGNERMRITSAGNVGIGTASPVAALDFGSSIRNRIINLWGSNTNGSSSTDFYGFGINASTLRYNVYGTADVHKFYGGSTEYGYINNASGFVNSFTGQHKSFPHESLFGKTSEDLCGLIVSASGEHISINDSVPQKGQGAIQVSEAIPTVKLSVVEKDKKVFGVVSDVEDVETSQRHDHYGAFVSTFEKELGDSRIYVNSIGEGAMWVVNTAGTLESGDYITTSNVAGYGQRQDSDSLKNYTVAKITMDCDFAPATQPIQIIKKELQDVNYWVNATYENVSLEEYSNLAEDVRTTTTEIYYSNEDGEITTDKYNTLESNVQSTYTELTRTIHQKISTEESKTEQEGSTLEVRQELINVLDEHGQLQWEDDPSGVTEKAYKIRYLDTSGQQTDEANAVHIAAFVGCTYHCG
jgi:hypothetical protein